MYVINAYNAPRRKVFVHARSFQYEREFVQKTFVPKKNERENIASALSKKRFAVKKISLTCAKSAPGPTKRRARVWRHGNNASADDVTVRFILFRRRPSGKLFYLLNNTRLLASWNFWHARVDQKRTPCRVYPYSQAGQGTTISCTGCFYRLIDAPL